MSKSYGNLLFTPNVVSVRYFKTSTDIDTGVNYDLYKLNSSYVKIFDYDDGLTVIFKANRTNSRKVYINIDGMTKTVNGVTSRRDIELLDKEKKSLENATVLVDEMYMCVYNYSLDKFVLLSATERGGMQTFSTLNELKLSNSIRDGVIAVTLGQDVEGDGRAAFYRVMLVPPVATENLQPVAVQNGLYIVEIKTAMNTTITELEQANLSNLNRLGGLEDSIGFVNRTSTALTTAFQNLFNGATGYAKTLLGSINFLSNFVNTIYPARNTEINNRFGVDEAAIYEIIGKDPNNVDKTGTRTKLDLHATADKAIELDHQVQIDYIGDITGSLTGFTGKNATYSVNLQVTDNSHVHTAESSLQGKRNIAGATNENLQTVINDKASTTTTNTFTQEQTFSSNIKSTKMTSLGTEMVLDASLAGNSSSITFKVKNSVNNDVDLVLTSAGITFSNTVESKQYAIGFSEGAMSIAGSTTSVATPNLTVTGTATASTSVTTPSYYFTGKNTRMLANGEGIEFRSNTSKTMAYILPNTFNLFSSNGNSLNVIANDTEVLFDSTSGIATYSFSKPSVFASSLQAASIESPSITVKKSSLEFSADIVTDYVSFNSSLGLNYYTYDKEVHFPSIKVGGTYAAPVLTVSGSTEVLLTAGSAATRFYMNKDLFVQGNMNCSSDIRLKSELIEMNGVLDKFSRLSAYSYLFMDEKERTIGVIADLIRQEFPELVRENKEGYLSVNYNGLAALSINANNELNKKVNRLEDELASLKSIVASMLIER